jgi:gamma-glutamylcysteine synthetase
MTHRIVVNVQTGETTQVDLTAEEVNALQIAEKIRLSQISYAIKRQAEYPSIIDYIDGVVKADQAQINKYIADCQAVKAKYPKG